MKIWLERQPDGSYIDWGRHGPGRTGPVRLYCGEAAEVMRLVLESIKADKKQPQKNNRLTV